MRKQISTIYAQLYGDADIMEREIADFIPEISGHSTIVATEPTIIEEVE
jgi:hypothetical protein